MRLEFSYSFDDLKEPLAPPRQAKRRGASRRRFISAIVYWALFTPFVGVMVWGLSKAPHRRWALDGIPIDLVSDVLPGALLATFLMLLLLSFAWSSWRKSRRPSPTLPAPRQGIGGRIFGFVVALLRVGSIFLLFQDELILLWPPTRAQRILVSGGPIAAMLLVLIVVSLLQRRWTARAQWHRGGWRRPKIVEIDERGYRITDDLMQLQYAWGYFLAARETENLLLLMAENEQQHAIPKRAFADASELNRCRALLRRVIGKTDLLPVEPTGFDVIPLPAMPPAAPMGQTGDRAEAGSVAQPSPY